MKMESQRHYANASKTGSLCFGEENPPQQSQHFTATIELNRRATRGCEQLKQSIQQYMTAKLKLLLLVIKMQYTQEIFYFIVCFRKMVTVNLKFIRSSKVIQFILLFTISVDETQRWEIRKKSQM